MKTTVFYRTFVTLLILNIMFGAYAIGKIGFVSPYKFVLLMFSVMLFIYIWFPLQSFFKKGE